MNACVFLDVETGGLRSDHPIIQLAAVAVDLSTWKELEAREWKLEFNPAACDAEALRVNGYSDADWKDAINEVTLVAELQQMLNRYTCVSMVSGRTGRPYTVARVGGHNVARFDIDRISRAFNRQSVFFPIHFSGILDTLQLASWLFAFHPELQAPKSYKLQDLAEYFHLQIDGRLHTALVDTRLTIELAKRLVEPLNGKIA